MLQRIVATGNAFKQTKAKDETVTDIGQLEKAKVEFLGVQKFGLYAQHPTSFGPGGQRK